MRAPSDSSGKENLPARLCFVPDWKQSHNGEIKGGSILAIEYARKRISEWPTHGGGYTPRDWWHYAHLRFHPGEIYQMVPLFYPDPPEMPSCDPVVVTVPAGTTQLEIWFEHILYHFESRQQPYVYWDSRYGENYWFPVTS